MAQQLPYYSYTNVYHGAFAGSVPLSGSSGGVEKVEGYYNAFIGGFAGHINTGSANSFLGSYSGYSNTTDSNNTIIGHGAGYYNTTASYNVFVGQASGTLNTTGTYNTFLGQGSGYANTTGNFNTFLGNGAGSKNASGVSNTFVGLNSGFNTTGSGDVMLGSGAGQSNTSGSGNTFIGTNAGALTGNPDLQNATAIGYGAQVSTSNSLILGAAANVGIGNTAPSVKLHLTSGTPNTSGLRLENLTASSPASQPNVTKFLTVDGSGNVILGSSTNSLRVGAEVWSTTGTYVQNANPGGVIIGQGVEKTPSDYNLFVSKGILTEKVKIAIKMTADWSDYVFEKGYELRSLAQVEQHIHRTGHLPGLPSAAEVVEKGVDVAKMDAKLLEKIEELTLYSIQQQKQIDQLEKLVKQLLEKK
ncbi:bZIP transcription factor [Spirosoma telluris]|uniref:bZIP transcription factor n=1 Tax=Spirosoma telluris TaxID=2183553 RepID=UPI0018DD0F42